MTSDNAESLVAYVAPPQSPPSALVGNRVLEPTMVQWRIDGEFIQSDVDHEDALPINDVPATGAEPVALRISEANSSTEMKLRAFDQLGDNGYPQPGDIGMEYDCGPGGDVCEMALNDDGSGIVTVRPDRSTRMFVVQAFYPTLEGVDMETNIADYSISWAVRNAGR